jgi:hypothetical protein
MLVTFLTFNFLERFSKLSLKHKFSKKFEFRFLSESYGWFAFYFRSVSRNYLAYIPELFFKSDNIRSVAFFFFQNTLTVGRLLLIF